MGAESGRNLSPGLRASLFDRLSLRATILLYRTIFFHYNERSAHSSAFIFAWNESYGGQVQNHGLRVLCSNNSLVNPTISYSPSKLVVFKSGHRTEQVPWVKRVWRSLRLGGGTRKNLRRMRTSETVFSVEWDYNK